MSIFPHTSELVGDTPELFPVSEGWWHCPHCEEKSNVDANVHCCGCGEDRPEPDPAWNARKQKACQLLSDALKMRANPAREGSAVDVFEDAKFEIRCGLKGL